MNASLRETAAVGAIVTVLLGAVAWAATAAKDPTKYDCREIVGYRILDHGSKGRIKMPILECPHKDKLAAGKCETHWLFGMRCKE